MEQPSFNEGDNPPLSHPTDSQNIPRIVKIQYRNMCIPNKIPRGGGRGVWEGLGMDTNMGFVMFVASSKYGNAYPVFTK